ncbi:MAG: hypothetical protein IK113_05600 [Bacteroidales bacterium]|nr:hypothetical protein [Bacteroidales bacterium]
MKKFFIYAAIAALVIPFVSCNNKIDYGGNGPQAKIEKAKNADNAKKITIQQGTAKDKGIKEIEFTDGGLYIVTREKTKADDNTEVITGTYTLENLVYILQNFGSVSFDGNGNVTIELQGGETVTATYQEEDKLPESDFSNSIAHTWRIDKVDISVVADGKNIGFVKDGCDLELIGKDIVEQAKSLGADVNVNLDQLKGYNVKSLSFTSSNTFIVEFTGAPVFKANVSGINLNSYKFTYKLEAGVDNELLNAEAECEFAPQTEKTAWLTVKVNADDFSGRVIFMMTVID